MYAREAHICVVVSCLHCCNVSTSVKWQRLKVKFQFSPLNLSWHLLQIHWFSIINSCVTVLLLTGFLATILMRVLKKDFVKYTRDDEAGKP